MESNGRTLSPLTVVLGLSAVFFVIFLILSSFLFFWRSPVDPGSRAKASLFGRGGAVGIVEVKGVIMDSKKVLQQLKDFEEDRRVKAVVVRLNSPGGAVAPSQEIYEAVKAYSKPLVVSMGSVAASGAYYIACGSKKVFANPGTITGSIGVVMEFANLRRLYEWAKVERFSIKTGKYKDTGSESREMRPDERELIQGLVDNVLVQFRTAVVQGRGLSMEKVVAVSDGRIMSGEQAKKAALVDELGTLKDAVDEAGRQAKITGEPEVVYPSHSRNLWLDYMLDRDPEDESASDAGSVLARWARAVFGLAEPVGAQDWLRGWAPGLYMVWSGA